MNRIFYTFLCLIFINFQVSAQPDHFAKIRQNIEQGDKKEALVLINKQLIKEPPEPEKQLLLFSKAVLTFENSEYVEAKSTLTVLDLKSFPLSPYVSFYLGQISLIEKDVGTAQRHFEKVLKQNPNIKLENDSRFQLAQIEIQEKKFKAAQGRLLKLEKRNRGEQNYADILFTLAEVEKNLKNNGAFCKSIKKIWLRFPNDPRVVTWGLLLKNNLFQGSPTNCHVSNEEKRDRIKSLQWAGLDKKAKEEIAEFKKEIEGNADESYSLDRLQAAYEIHEGNTAEGIALLKKHYNSRKTDFNYLIALASATARNGDGAAAVGLYHQAYKLSPRSKPGRQALYQSAFLSYQFQDYDGASRRFREFTKIYPKSGLSRDANWYLAWMRYLRADYTGAIKSMAEYDKRASKKTKNTNRPQQDRIQYWTAMSHFRLGNYEKAREIFADLASDKLMGFYTVLAKQRLKQVQSISPKIEKRILAFGARGSQLQPDLSDIDISSLGIINTDPNIEQESEEKVAKEMEQSIAGPTAEVSTETEGSETAEESSSTKEENGSPFSAPQLAERFERAKSLVTIGLKDWAKWDLFDIERKTSKKDYLKNLMHEYEALFHFQRSSYIGQIYFGTQRKILGMLGGKSLWESTYPQAYANSVRKFSREFGISSELVWGIMRAESHYKRDAISPVGALGLMQVMPTTGKRIAEMLNEKEFNPQSLLQPETAIKIGSRYLQRLSKKFDQSIPLIAASYNAGPHRTKSWVSTFGHLDMDEFIEHIPFLETRNYVKKVVSNVAVYSQLYSQNGDKKESKKDSKNEDILSGLNEPLKYRLTGPAPTRETWEDI
jgi:soluble lytic murein transglycosylase